MNESTRFAFGANWRRYLTRVDESHLASARDSLVALLGTASLAGHSFLDIGCGSGIFSLAARHLGARVYSFDYDQDSRACAQGLKDREFPGDPDWRIEIGSVLDAEQMAGLGQFDVVYALGVLHHTGDLWLGFAHAIERVALGGRLVVALYNDQGWISRWWTVVKRAYNEHPILRGPLIACYTPYLVILRLLVRAATGRLKDERGMSIWYDMIDWLGGWPFEIATPRAVREFARDRGLRLVREKTVGRRHGCNEFVFERPDQTAIGVGASIE